MRKAILVIASVTIVLAVLLIGVWKAVVDERPASVATTDGTVSSAEGAYNAVLQHDGRSRNYLLHVPPQASSGTPLPLLVVLHGGGGAGDQMDWLTGFNAIASREGFLVAYPNAVGRNWNDGRPGVRSTAAKEDVDDRGFILALIGDAAAKLPIDPSRIYAAGISNGAIMLSRLACEASGIIAAVALVVGTAPEGFEQSCKPSRPVPLLAFLGTDDPLVPYEGGEITAVLPFLKRGRVVSAAALERFWSVTNGCSSTPEVVRLTDISVADRSHVVRHSYPACKDSADVVIHHIQGGGHTWPEGKQYLPSWLIGPTNRDINASEVMWSFFKAHALQQ